MSDYPLSSPKRSLRKRLTFTTQYPNITITLNYSVEAHSASRYDGDDAWHAVQVCRVQIHNGEKFLKSWYYQRPVIGKGFAKDRDRMLNRAREWLSSYNYNASYPRPVKCNCVGNSHAICPNVYIGEDGKAGCDIWPNTSGYVSYGSPRPFPEEMVCDVYTIMIDAKFTWDVPGSPLNLREFWLCASGKAIKDFEAPKENEDVKWV